MRFFEIFREPYQIFRKKTEIYATFSGIIRTILSDCMGLLYLGLEFGPHD